MSVNSFKIHVCKYLLHEIVTWQRQLSPDYFRVWNKHAPTFINFWNFFQELWSYYGLKRLKFYYISVHILRTTSKLYTPSTLNIDFIQWHTQLNVCAVKWITHDLIHDFHFTFQAYALPHTLNGICVSLFKFHTWILRQF